MDCFLKARQIPQYSFPGPVVSMTYSPTHGLCVTDGDIVVCFLHAHLPTNIQEESGVAEERLDEFHPIQSWIPRAWGCEATEKHTVTLSDEIDAS